MRAICAVGIMWFLATMAGCAAEDQSRSVRLRLQEVEHERNGLAQALNAEKAKTAALKQQLAAGDTRQPDPSLAEANSLRMRVEALTKSNAEYKALIEKQAQRKLERPVVPASPLPSDVDAALQSFARKYSGRVWYERGRGAISFANDQLFEPGSDTVRSNAHAALGDLAGIAALTSPHKFELVVVGHTDNTPITKPDTLAKHPTNWHLSVHRAIAVKKVLVSSGLPEKRMGVMGYGPYRPLGNDRARNRRVEVFLVPKGAVQAFAPVAPGGSGS